MKTPEKDESLEALEALDEDATGHAASPPFNSPEESARAHTTALFHRSTISALDFSKMEIPEREVYLAPFFRAGDYGLLFAPRGVGKSWLSLLMGKALSESGKMGTHWQCNEPRRVLYLDSEMNIADLQKRCQLLEIVAPGFHILSHETVFTESDDELSLNLADLSQQQAILDHCMNEKIEVLILDNLSTAFKGLNENESDSWEMVSAWLLDLRRRGIAVVLVCHAGRNGNIRGTSRREDAAHWILSLEEGDSSEENTHVFQSRFTKCRNCAASQVPPLEWTIKHTDQGCTVTTDTIDLQSQMIDLINGGMHSASLIAEKLGKGKGTISKWAKKLQNEGRIRIVGLKYLPA